MAPLYDYQCASCGLRFEAQGRMSSPTAPKPCTGCGTSAERILPPDVQGVFEQPVTGPGPQNTGVAEVDANFDRVIGKSAQAGWEVQRRRVEDKREVLASVGGEGPDLSRTPDGGWRVMPPEERRSVETLREVNHEVSRYRLARGPRPKGLR